MGDLFVSEGTLTLPYGVLRTLHYGGGEVRLYRNVITQSLHVGKRISLLGREGTLAAREATLLRDIEHDNVADIYDVAEVAGTDNALAIIEMTMPYYERGSIFDALARGERFGSGEGRDIALRALRGLSHLHDAHGILHRDIKTPNLFLTTDKKLVKVGDLGEAVRMDAGGEAAALLSVQFWAPPETFVGVPHTVRSDIYSMGMSLAEILSGPFPYDDYGVERLAQRLEQGWMAVLPRDLAFQPHVSDALRRIVRKAIQRDPDARYPSASAMINALARAGFIDWQWPAIGDQSTEWLGRWRGDDYRVLGRTLRSGNWRVQTERRYPSGWRRLGQFTADGPDLSAAAETVFRQIDRHLVRA